ncbi:MAG: hypothetical protein RR063_10485 [Anaerovoracaceae bacterium]
MTLFRLIKYDIKNGIFLSWHKLLIGVLYAVSSCIILDKQIQNAVDAKYLSSALNASVFDYLCNIFKGIDRYNFNVKGGFQIPALWCLFFVCYFFIIGRYIVNDLYGFGTNILLKSKSRRAWWISKCIWVFTTAFVYYFIIVVTVIVYCGLKNNVSFCITKEILAFHVSANLWVAELNLRVTLLVLPILVLFTMGILQITISLLISPIVGLLAIIGFLVASIYFYAPVLVGNFMILKRSEAVIGGFANSTNAFIYCLLMATIAFFVGLIWFERKDILKNE